MVRKSSLRPDQERQGASTAVASDPTVPTLVRDLVGEAELSLRAGFLWDAIRPVGRATPGRAVTDAPDVYILASADDGQDGVLSISNPEFPDFIARAAETSQRIHDLLSGETARPVLCPLLSGRAEGRSYAIYARLRTIPEGRVRRRIVQWRLTAPVTDWLGRIASQTLRPATGDRISVAIDYLRGDHELSADLRQAADRIASDIANGRFNPEFCLQHGDFWYGNVLLPWKRPAHAREFSVIDWAGASEDGYPFTDMITFLRSCGVRPARARKWLGRYAAGTGLPVERATEYLCLSLGWLGAHRDNFPLHRYRQMADAAFAYMRAVTG